MGHPNQPTNPTDRQAEATAAAARILRYLHDHPGEQPRTQILAETGLSDGRFLAGLAKLRQWEVPVCGCLCGDQYIHWLAVEALTEEMMLEEVDHAA